MAQAYKVVFTGNLDLAANAEDAIRDFASVFKVSEEQARALISGGQARVLKTDVDATNARRYQEVLHEIGLESRVEPMDAAMDVDRQTPQEKPQAPTRSAAGDGGLGSGADDTAAQDRFSAARQSSARSPASAVQGDASSPLTAGPARRPASHGWAWIRQAWQQFKAQPWTWLAAVALVYLATFAVSLVPVAGSLATMILGPIFAGGLMLGARSQERDGRLRIAAGFDGFSSHGGQLALVGLLYLGGIFLVFMVAGLVLMAGGVLTAGSLEALSSNDPELAAAVLGPGIALVLLVLVLAMVPLLMLYWFAPALVALDGMTAVEAMRMSFRGCWKNMIPFIVYALALLFILVGASLAVGLVSALLAAVSEVLMVAMMILLIPLMLVFAALIVLSIYTAYRDVFYAATRSHGTLAF